jgi:hypothetical protein
LSKLHNAVFASPNVDFSAWPRVIQADMVVAYESEFAKRTVGPVIRSRLEEFLIRPPSLIAHTSLFVTALASVSRHHEILFWKDSPRGMRYLHYGTVMTCALDSINSPSFSKRLCRSVR